MIRLKNIRLLGRYINPETNRAVNIHRGDRNVGQILFYYFRQNRIIVPESEFWGKWKKETPKEKKPKKSKSNP